MRFHAIVTGVAMVIAVATLAAAQPPAETGACVYAPFPLTDVKVHDARLVAAQEANRRYLHSLDEDSLLWTFRTNAGLPAPGKPFGGWERPESEVRGHCTGHFLYGCALMYASAGDEELKAKAARIVAELAKCQDALGGGYLSAYPESFWDRYLAQKPVWAPFYTIHKIMAGLYDQYVLCGNAQALEVFKGMASYFSKRLEKVSVEDMKPIIDHNEEGGVSEALWNLYAITSDPAHRALAEKLERRNFLDPLARGEDVLAKRHGNTHIPLAVGATRRYEITGEKAYLDLAEYFWDRVVTPRSYATGGSTDGEIWGEPFKLAAARSTTNHETCKTYNMLRLTRHLIGITGDARYGDFYERAFFNGILGTQEPASGALEYYVPMATGFQRVFGTAETSFWCCTGTGMETWSKLGDSLYFHNADTLYVNLFVSSEVDWKDKGVRLEQRTAFPVEQGTSCTVHSAAPVTFTLALRAPAWAEGIAAAVNGEDVSALPGTDACIHIAREWREGDTVTLALPMTLRTWPMPDDPNLVAFLYGPVVLAAVLSEGEPNAPLISDNPNAPQIVADCNRHAYYFVSDSPRDLAWLQPVPEKPLTFRAEGQPFPLTFVPFNAIVGERYGIYFPVVPAGSERAAQLDRENQVFAQLEQARAERAARTTDAVVVGDAANEAAHNLQGKGTANGAYQGHNWRHAEEWWSWDFAVAPDVPMALVCTLWGSDVGREFEILVDGTVIATQKLENNRPGQFFDETYAIPQKLTKGKTKITVRFEKKQGFAGGVFECALVRLEK